MKRYIKAEHFTEEYAFSSDAKARAYAAAHTDDPAILEIDAHDPDTAVRACVANNRNTPADVLEYLADDPSLMVIGCLATNSNTPVDTLRKIYAEHLDAHDFLVKNPNLPTDMLTQMALDTNDSDILGSIMIHPNTSAEVLDALFASTNAKLNVSQRENVPEEIQLRLAHDPSSYIRANLARHTELDSVLALLSNDEESGIRERVASNPHISLELVVKLASDPYVKVTDAVERSRYGYDPQVLVAFANNEANGDARECAAMNYNTPADCLRKLAKDPKPSVKYFVASNRNTPSDVLLDLAHEDTYDILESVAKNPNTPKEAYFILKDYKGWNDYSTKQIHHLAEMYLGRRQG